MIMMLTGRDVTSEIRQMCQEEDEEHTGCLGDGRDTDCHLFTHCKFDQEDDHYDINQDQAKYDRPHIASIKGYNYITAGGNTPLTHTHAHLPTPTSANDRLPC
jgi:predicted DNA-binding protein with PD1-like motif